MEFITGVKKTETLELSELLAEGFFGDLLTKSEKAIAQITERQKKKAQKK